MTEHESKDKGMNRAWVFLGGCLAGVASVFMAAIMSDPPASLEGGKEPDEEAQLVLPEGEAEGS